MNGDDRLIEAMAVELSKKIEEDYKEFIKDNPNGKEPEWILFIAKKYGKETTPHKNIQNS